GIATVVPPLIVGLHDPKLGVSEAHLRFVLRRLVHRFGRSASPLFACALAFRLGFGTPLALGLSFSFGPCCQALHGRLNGSQAVCTARQLGRQLITPAAPQGRIVLGVL